MNLPRITVIVIASLTLPSAAAVDYDEHVRPVLESLCMDCHNDSENAGHLSYQGLLAEHALGARGELLEDLEFVIDLDEMPPADAERQLTPEEREHLLTWTRQSLAHLRAARPHDPGPVVMPRLTRAEYSRVLSAIAGRAIDPGAVLPQEATAGSGFTNVGAAHSMPMPLVEKYLAAASKALDYLRVSPVHGFEWHSDPVREAISAEGMRDYLVSEWTRLHLIANDSQSDHRNALKERFGHDMGAYLYAAWLLRAEGEPDAEAFARTAAAIDEHLNPHSLELFWRLLTATEVEPEGEYQFIAEMQAAWRALPAEGVDGEIRAACIAMGRELWRLGARPGYDLPFEERGPVRFHQLWKAVEANEPPPIHLEFPHDRERRPRTLFLCVGPLRDEQAGDVAVWSEGSVVFDGGGREGAVPLHEVVDGFHTEDGRLIRWGHHPAGRTVDGQAIAQAATSVWRIELPEHVREFIITPCADPTAPEPGLLQAFVLPEPPSAEDLRFRAGRIPLSQAGSGLIEWFEDRHDAAGELTDPHRNLSYGNGPSKAKHVFMQGFAAVDPDYLGRADWPHRPNLERDHSLDPMHPFRLLLPGLAAGMSEQERAYRARLIADLAAAAQVPHQDLQAFVREQGLAEHPEGAAAPPDEVAGWAPDVQRRYRDLLDAVHAVEAEWRQTAAALIADFATRAWRRAPEAGELSILMSLYDEVRAAGDSSFEGAVEQALQAVLMAPQFLYRAQYTRHQEEPYPLDDRELAERLAFFLWGSLPDEGLLARAAAGELGTDEALRAEVARMLGDERSRSLATDFVAQWLVFADFGEHAVPDPEKFSEWKPALARSMYRESVLFFAELFREDRPITDALFADYTYLDERLARHYGIGGVDGEEFRRVAVDPARRGGIFGMGSVLTKMSMPLRTSPVNRGNWIVQAVLGYDLPEPPPDVDMLSDEPVSDEGLTIREQLARHRADPACMGCHQRIDPPGIALENFDPIGRWREQGPDGEAIDAVGEMADGARIAGIAGLREWFRQDENRERFLRQFCRKLAAYGLGRQLLVTDHDLIEGMVAALEADGYRPSAAIQTLVLSQQFRYRRDQVSQR